MKKHRALWVIIIVIVVLAAAAAGGWYWLSTKAARAEQAHSTVYTQYTSMTAAVDSVTLTVTEDGSPVGEYDLQKLGLRDDLMNKVTAQFSETDRMTAEQFAALGIREKLNWAKNAHPAPYPCTVSMEQFDAAAVLADLQSMKRTAAENAYTVLEAGVYTVHAEVPGNELNESADQDGLRASAASLGVTADGPQDAAFELTSVDCYKQPEITTATLRDTPDSLFRKALAELEIKVTFNADTAQYLPHGEETLTSHDLASIVDLDPDGTVTVDEKVLSEKVSKLAEGYSKQDAPFLFDSWVKGLTEIRFITCDYRIAVQSLPEQIRVVGCWAHARRKFDEAVNSLPKQEQAGSAALEGQRYCNALFALEKELAGLTGEKRYKQRQERAKPILDALLAWAETKKAPPKSALGKALHYLREQWPWLIRYLEDGRLEISNNRAERSIKPFVMDRKNFLFANPPNGAQGSAIIFSMIETAKENGLDPFHYLVWVLQSTPGMNKTAPDWAAALMPENAPKICFAGNRD